MRIKKLATTKLKNLINSIFNLPNYFTLDYVSFNLTYLISMEMGSR
jgi:hypothetical protein